MSTDIQQSATTVVEFAPRPIHFSGTIIGAAACLRSAARIGFFHGAHLDPFNLSDGDHVVVETAERFAIETRVGR